MARVKKRNGSREFILLEYKMAAPPHKIHVLSLAYGTFTSAMAQLTALHMLQNALGKPLREHFKYMGGCGIGGIIVLLLYNGIDLIVCIEATSLLINLFM